MTSKQFVQHFSKSRDTLTLYSSKGLTTAMNGVFARMENHGSRIDSFHHVWLNQYHIPNDLHVLTRNSDCFIMGLTNHCCSATD